MPKTWNVIFERPTRDQFGYFESITEVVLTDSIDKALEWAKKNIPKDYPMIGGICAGSSEVHIVD